MGLGGIRVRCGRCGSLRETMNSGDRGYLNPNTYLSIPADLYSFSPPGSTSPAGSTPSQTHK